MAVEKILKIIVTKCPKDVKDVKGCKGCGFTSSVPRPFSQRINSQKVNRHRIKTGKVRMM